MTDTPQASPRPPAGDTQPIPVHVASMAAEIILGQAPERPPKAFRAEYDTVTVDTTNPVRPLLPASRRRARAVIFVHPPPGAASNTTAYGWLAGTEAGATNAARTQQGGTFISITAYSPRQIEIRGSGALWVALDNTATTELLVGVMAEYEA